MRVVLCWHMHQPSYKDIGLDEYALPWVYLHAIKDYVDMAAHLETHPAACAVVNFSPVLMEQIEDYSAQVNGWLHRDAQIKDPILRLLTPGGIPDDARGRAEALRACMKANRVHLIERFEAFKTLEAQASQLLAAGDLINTPPHFFADLAVWYHLAWLGETVRQGDPRVQDLMAQERQFSPAQQRQLLEIIGEMLASVIPRYRRLMGSGQVELSVTPWGHPIVPLMLDFKSARDAWPQVALPEHAEYPGGDDRASWHVARAIQVFTRAFGVRPRGCWPSEGGVSEQTIRMMDRFGFDWVASGEQVLRNTLEGNSAAPQTAFCLPQSHVRCFFRHDDLSDRVGFTYATWYGDDAVSNLVNELEAIEAQAPKEEQRVLSIVLDGENAWEHYPSNGFFFLDALYKRLSEHPRLQLSTFSQCLAADIPTRELPRVVAGSWVYGTFSTWIGHPAKNRAWDMLCSAKEVFDQVVVEGALTEEQERAVERQLGVCEGSDWFWWFGDDNPASTVAEFDALYRRHLGGLYRLLGEVPPDYLAQPFAYGHGAAESVTVMKRSHE